MQGSQQHGDVRAVEAEGRGVTTLPPFICAVYASAQRHGAFTTGLLALRSGLSLRTVERLSARLHWDGVKIGVDTKFFAACNINPKQPAKVLRYFRETMLSETPLPHLSAIQRQAFNRRMKQWLVAKKDNPNA